MSRSHFENNMSQELALPAAVNTFEFAPGGVFARAASMLNTAPANLLDILSSNRYELPMDDALTERARHIPPQTAAGVFGPQKSDVLIIGKMPNNFEANTGVPFVGAPGEIWRSFFKDNGVDVSGWMLTYAVTFKVPDYLAGKGQIKVAYLKDGLCLLDKVVNEVQPKFVLLFGADALRAWNSLYDKKRASSEKFTDSRGAVLNYPDGRKAVCSISPNDVANDPAQLQEFKRDLGLFLSTIRGQARTAAISPKVDVVNTIADLSVAVDKLIAQPDKLKYSLDLEWGPGEVLRTIQIANSKEHCLVLQCNKAGMVPTELHTQHQHMIGELQRLFHRPGVGIIGHNVRGDVKILRKHGLDLLPQFSTNGFDTMVGYHLIGGNETLDKQLELVSFCLLNTDRYDKPVREWLRANGYNDAKLEERAYGDIPDDILIPYGAMDACCTFGIYEVILEKFKEWPGVDKLYFDVCHPVNEPILEMEEAGLLVDMDRLLSLTDLFLAKRQEMLQDLQAEIGWAPRTENVTVRLKNSTKVKVVEHAGFNPDSVDHMREILFGLIKHKDGVPQRKAPPNVKLLSLEPVKATNDAPWEDVVKAKKTHLYSPSTDSESLGILAGENPLARKLQRYKFLAQITKMFLCPYSRDSSGKIVFEGGVGASLSPDNRMRTSFRTTLETGRYATTPSAQCFPKKQEKELLSIFTGPDKKLDPRYKSIRSIFVAKPGCVLVEADWNQAELWTLGYIAKDFKFIDTLKTSDIHTKTTIELFADKVIDGKRIGDYTVDEFNKARKNNKVLDAFRGISKTIVFGPRFPN